MRVYYVTGTEDGNYVAGYIIASDREGARRAAQGRGHRGRPRQGEPTVKVTSIQPATGLRMESGSE
jgi:hypothetical protein